MRFVFPRRAFYTIKDYVWSPSLSTNHLPASTYEQFQIEPANRAPNPYPNEVKENQCGRAPNDLPKPDGAARSSCKTSLPNSSKLDTMALHLRCERVRCQFQVEYKRRVSGGAVVPISSSLSFCAWSGLQFSLTIAWEPRHDVPDSPAVKGGYGRWRWE